MVWINQSSISEARPIPCGPVQYLDQRPDCEGREHSTPESGEQTASLLQQEI